MIQRLMILLFIFTQHSVLTDLLDFDINPSCDPSLCNVNGSVNFFTVRYQLDNTSNIHFIIANGLKLGTLTIIEIKSNSLNSEIAVDWKALLSHERGEVIKLLHGDIMNASCFQIKRVIAFNDTNLDASYNKTTLFKAWDLSQLRWNQIQFSDVNGDDNSITFSTQVNQPKMGSDGSNITELLGKKGSISIKFKLSSTAVINKEFPSLKFTGGSIQTEILLDSLNTKLYNCTRYGLEISLLTDFLPSNNISHKVKVDKSFDDEYTPGVFKTFTLVNSDEDDGAAFLQWKDIAYIHAKRSMLSGVDVKYSTPLLQFNLPSVNQSIAQSFYNDSLPSATSFNVTFGQKDDGFYKGHSLFVISFGLNPYPSESISFFALFAIIVCMGLPVIAIVIGGIYLLKNRFGMRQSGDSTLFLPYEAIVNHDN